ncbi:VOC family protein [Streptomyces sp. NBC_01795]|uniref:VOC family protein n=1 Tax=unclassified Streptomyces TaxID=2593676 RepID=UPI002DDC728F|nr:MULTISPECIES: VOC family protein [unclassified Streptomyces]WSA95681.1 VOC family protein [Streptomyces sp. NBC_01795]WSS11692.1 VOC family protein [Streptomyces sp. NBC_01186]
MSVNAVTHLNFRGDAREALTFYQSVFGGDVAVVTYKDAGNVQEPAGADQVMWGQVAADSGFRVMAYDVPADMPWNQGENAFFVSLRGETTEEITAYWKKLSDGAAVLQPLEPAQWAPLYGMLKDRFGVTWVLDAVSEYNAS